MKIVCLPDFKESQYLLHNKSQKIATCEVTLSSWCNVHITWKKKHWLEPGSELYVTWIWIDKEVNMLYYVKFISSVT